MSRITRSGRQIVQPERYFAVAILSGAVIVLCLLVMLLSANAAGERNLGAAQGMRLFWYSAAVERSEVAMLHCIAISGLGVGIAGFVTAIAIYIRG